MSKRAKILNARNKLRSQTAEYLNGKGSAEDSSYSGHKNKDSAPTKKGAERINKKGNKNTTVGAIRSRSGSGSAVGESKSINGRSGSGNGKSSGAKRSDREIGGGKRKESFGNAASNTDSGIIDYPGNAVKNFGDGGSGTGGGKSRFTVVRGRKRRRTVVLSSVAAAIVIFILIFHICTPTGIIEYIQNSYALTQDNGDNTMTDTNATVAQFQSVGNAVYLLTDSYFEIFNSKGYNVLYFKHGFASPVLEVSSARTVIFDRGGRKYKTFNCASVLYEGTAVGNIISAAMGNNGRYAIASSSSGYAAEVNVYSKNNEVIYTWKSVSNLISAVRFNNSGGKLAVAQLYTEGGILSSKVELFGLDSAQPYCSLSFNGEAVTSLITVSDKLVASSEGKVYLINWKNGEYDTIDTGGVISFLEEDINGRLTVVYSRSDKQTFNNIRVYNEKAEEVFSAEINAVLADIKTDKNGLYAVYDNKLCTYDAEGKLVSSVADESNIQRIAFVNGGRTVVGCGTTKIIIFKE